MAQGGRETEIRTSRHPTKLRHGPPINVHLLISPGIGHRSMPIGIPILDPVEPRTQPAINESVTWPDASQTLNNRAINKIRIVVSRSPFRSFFLSFSFLPPFFFLSQVKIPRNRSCWKVLDSRLGYSILPDCHSNRFELFDRRNVVLQKYSIEWSESNRQRIYLLDQCNS